MLAEPLGTADGDFNPRTREGCDSTPYKGRYKTRDISIHAPVKGATRQPLIYIYSIIGFQSTHP